MQTRRVLYVGTVGMAVWMSDDLGRSWTRPRSHAGLYVESSVWALSLHPADPEHILAGTDRGLFQWSETGKSWRRIPSPMDKRPFAIWSIARHPASPDHMLVGTQPGCIFHTTDGGRHWEAFGADIAHTTDFTAFETRVTRVRFDPDDDRTWWASIEADEIRVTRDAGQTWQRVNQGFNNPDIHDIAVLHDKQGQRYLAATSAYGTHFSHDDGRSWALREIDAPWQYSRTIVPRADGQAIFLTNGDGPPGSQGNAWRSTDDCRSWHKLPFPRHFNSTPWSIAVDPADPMLVLLATNLGQLFLSQDGGDSWRKLEREFGEIRCVMWRDTPCG